MSVSQNYPALKPSLLLDFANTGKLDPRVTFSRPTVGGYYDGKTVVKAEENLALQSQDLTASWSLINLAVTSNTDIAPDGTTTADLITEDSSSNVHLTIQGGKSSTGVITLSVFAKPGTGSRFLTIGFNRLSTVYASATFDLSAGTNTQTLVSTYTGVSADITASGQGFYRCSITATVDSISEIRVGMSETSTFASVNRGFDSYTGDGTSSIILWGAQLEQRSSVTAYTPTTTQPITNYIPVLQTAPANVARFDHNPVSGESLGLLVEEQRTNLLERSEEFDARWGKVRSSITANTIVAPDGALTGDKLVEDTTADNSHFITQSVSVPSGSYSYSVFAKRGERNGLSLRAQNASGTERIIAWFNLDTGATYYTSGAGLSTFSQSLGNGWYRCTISGTFASANVAVFSVAIGDTSVSEIAFGNPTYTGDGYSGIYIWGAQLEVGAFPTSYIKTEASQVTRSADSASMTGTNFSDWYRADEGTFYDESVAAPIDGNVKWVYSANNGTGTARIFKSYAATTRQTRLEVGGFGAAQAILTSVASFTNRENTKQAAAYKTDDFSASTNATTVLTDTSGRVPTVDRFDIGFETGRPNASYLSSTIKKIAYYPKALSATELQALTS
jgi:hypothetical protein